MRVTGTYRFGTIEETEMVEPAVAWTGNRLVTPAPWKWI